MTPRRPAPAAPSPLLLGLGFVVLTVLAACGPSGPSVAPLTPLPTVAATLAPSPSPAATAAAASPTPTPVAGTSACDPTSLAAQITAWDSGAGHRTATVTLTSNGRADCTIHTLAKPELVGGDGKVLMAGTLPTSNAVITLHYYDVVTTMVSADNYCGANPVPPVTVAFVFPAGEGTVTAAALNATDTSGVPPCMGAANQGQIEMHPFAP